MERVIDEAKLFPPSSSASFWSAVIFGAREHLTQREQTTHAYRILTSQKRLEYLYPIHSLSVPPSLSTTNFCTLYFCLSPPSISLSTLSSFIRPTGLLRPAWQGQSLHVFICIRGVETDEYIDTDPLFLRWAQQTLMQWKGFLNRIVYVSVWK